MPAVRPSPWRDQETAVVNDLVCCRYQITEVLGQGAMGIVWKAHDVILDRDIALKELRPGPGVSTADAVDRFLVEARAAARLNHPNIVAIYDVISDGPRALIAMEFVDGPTLDVTAGTGALPAATVRAIMAQVAQALAVAHHAGVIHRDLKPDNIFWTANSRAVVADFGLARIGASSATIEGTVMGTLGYMAPEQVRGSATGPEADVFGWGAVGYHLATGRPPFGQPESDPTALAYRVVHEDPPPLELPDDPHLAQLITNALAKDPDRRPANGTQLVQALVGDEREPRADTGRDDRRDVHPDARPQVGWDRPEPSVDARTWHRARWVVAAVTLVAAISVVSAVALTGRNRSTGPETTTAADLGFPTLPSDVAPIAPGTYQSSSFQPGLTLTLHESWTGSFESDGLLQLSRPDLVQAGQLSSTVTLIRLQNVYDPNRSYESNSSYTADPSAIEKLPSDVFAWLCQHPRLAPCQHVSDQIGDNPIMRLDVSVRDGYRSEGCLAPGTACVFTFYQRTLRTRYIMYEGMDYGFYLTRVNNDEVLMAIEAPADSFDAFLPTAKDLLATIHF